nr:unnamed protein product [Digitaria exilis]
MNEQARGVGIRPSKKPTTTPSGTGVWRLSRRPRLARQQEPRRGSKPPEEVGQTTNPIRQIGKVTYPCLTAENGSSPDVPVAGDEAEAVAVAAEEGHGHKLRTAELDSE